MREPYSIEAEHGLLGAMMQRPELIDTLSDDLTAESFYFPENADVYRAIMALRSTGQAVDFLTVGNHIGELGSTGTPAFAYCAEIVRNTPSVANSGTYAQIVRERAYLTSLNLVGVDMDAIPEDVKLAGAELAVVASQGKLYQQHTEGSLEAKTVKAGSVTTSKTFASIDTTKSSSLPDGVQFALGLLGPWRTSAFSFNVYR